MAERERRLLEEIEQVWDVLGALGVALAVLDDGIVTDVTDNLPELFGVDREWLIGQRAGRALSSDAAGFESDRRSALLADPSPLRHRVPLLHADGSAFEVELATSRTFDPTVLALRKRDELARTERLLDQLIALVDHVPNGLLVFDVDDGSLRLSFLNRSAMPIAGLDHFEDVGATIEEVFPSVSTTTIAQIVALADSADRLVLPSAQFVPARDTRAYEALAVGLPGARVALRFMDLTDLLERESHRLRLLQRLVSVGDDERSHLAMAVHDDVIQELAAAALLVESIDLDVGEHPMLERALSALHRGTASLRRIVYDLSPPTTVDAGFRVSLERAVTHVLGPPETPAALLDLRLDHEVDDAVQAAAIKILTELLRNVTRHAEATQVDIELATDTAGLALVVTDDGVGFGGTLTTGHFGLQMVIDRATALGGDCRIRSSPGEGTTVEVVLPRSTATTEGPGPVMLVESPSHETGLILGVSEALAAVGAGMALQPAMRRAFELLEEFGLPAHLQRADTSGPLLDLTGAAVTRAPLEGGGRALGWLVLADEARPIEAGLLAWLGHQVGNAIARAPEAERADFWRSSSIDLSTLQLSGNDPNRASSRISS